MARDDDRIKKQKLTAGDKCAFGNMIFAKTKKEGWTPATKVLAVTYLDLSEKCGYAFARQPYLQFRTGMSTRTMSRANNVLKESKLFDLRYLTDDSLEVVPNLERIRAEYEKYQEEERCFKQERRDKKSGTTDLSSQTTPPVNSVDTPTDKMSGAADKTAGGRRQNGGHIPSKEALYPNPSNCFHTHSDERAETGSGFGKDRPSGGPADVLDAIDFSACVDDLEKSLPPFERFGDFKQVDRERSRRGAIYQMRKLARLGWNLDEIRQFVEAYRRDYDEQAKTNFKRNGQCGKTLASLLAYLVDQCGPSRNDDTCMINGWKLPERFFHEPQPVRRGAADNDNQEPVTKPRSRYGTYGGPAGR
ncbi:hypothetical protein [Bradyrhizobium sp. RT5a]|uniref:hypothetical protein n=1 Tax=Bradyrhizobium sp. RT5a TaxID=3156380 RepID=UPI003390E0F2